MWFPLVAGLAPACAGSVPSHATAASEPRFIGETIRAHPEIAWRSSRAIGRPQRGRLVRGVRLPASGDTFRTWDPATERVPSRWWRRYGTGRLVATILHVADEQRKIDPDAPPLLVGDLSRPHGGNFGRRFGALGHLSHQNGLDVDIYYPRTPGRLIGSRPARQIDIARSRWLVCAFARAGATRIYVDRRIGIRLVPGRIDEWPNHDNHFHVRIARSDPRPPAPACRSASRAQPPVRDVIG